ncbi:hypothetical protein [Rahnella sp. Larv3_ips]|uniref:hypothetical protein n=1 Tax=Rahnella sp. Larv3_ips TaxID=1896943 RepID=UPI0013CEF0E6|nr:hypothetical protein [Rahnella sp. Larv3_ips]
MFQTLRLLPQTPPLRGTLISGSNPLGKNLAVSHRSFDVVLSAANGFFKVKTMCLILLSSFHIAGAEKYLFYIAFGRAQKSRWREWWKTARLFARVVTRAEGTAQRRDFAAIAGAAGI